MLSRPLYMELFLFACCHQAINTSRFYHYFFACVYTNSLLQTVSVCTVANLSRHLFEQKVNCFCLFLDKAETWFGLDERVFLSPPAWQVRPPEPNYFVTIISASSVLSTKAVVCHGAEKQIKNLRINGYLRV
jgi:hypothetical protein